MSAESSKAAAGTLPKTPASMTAGELVAAASGGKWHYSKSFRILKAGKDHGEMHLIGIGNGAAHIGYVSITPCVAEDEARANAELIVRGVGAFGALVAAVEELQKHAEWMGCPRGYDMRDFAATFEMADKALALANGGGL